MCLGKDVSRETLDVFHVDVSRDTYWWVLVVGQKPVFELHVSGT